MNSSGGPETVPRLAVVNSHPIQYFAPLYRELHESGQVDITVFYGSRQGVANTLKDAEFGQAVVWDIPLLEGYQHRFLRNLGGERGIYGFFSLINLEIVPAILGGRYDAVLVHGHNYFTSLLAIAATKISGAALLMRGETHLLLPRKGLKRLLRKPLMRAFYKVCDAFLYLGARNREFYRHHGVPDERLFFVPYTVDNDRFARDTSVARQSLLPLLRAQLALPAGMPVVLFASKLIERKRPHDLLEAFARVRARGTLAALVFVGDGPLRDGLETAVSEGNIPDVRFAGFRNQGELPAYYALADVFALPSTDEPWGLVINEVMAAGVPVIASEEVGCAEDLVRDGETGFQVRSGDIDALTEKLELILTNPRLRAQLSAAAEQRMKTWSYHECVIGITAAIDARSRRWQRRNQRS